MTNEQKKQRRRTTKLVMVAATWPSGSSGFEGEFAAAIDSVIAELGLKAIDLTIDGKDKALSYVLKAAPTRFLPALNCINRELEATGKARFRLLPLVSSNVPGFITID